MVDDIVVHLCIGKLSRKLIASITFVASILS